jgi:hypothetical protein
LSQARKEAPPFDKLRANGDVGERRIGLAPGTLHLEVDGADWPLDSLCDFATRRNPKRGFLVVSKVLGRHIPVAPSRMRAAVRDLAARLPDLPSPTLVVGLAETAVCLGQAVHAELARRPTFAGLYLHSTRQQVDHPLLCRFEEPHSHASAHLIYRPEGIDLAAIRSLVLIDDEISTGTTLVNLAAALAAHLPGLEQIAAAAFTDWSGEGAWLARMPRPARRASLLSGALRWEAGPAPVDAPAFAAAAPRLGELHRHANFGRLGVTADATLPLPDPALPPRSRVRIMCTGEFTYPPFLLAERLEQEGHDVVVQSTTRSPALPGGAIRHTLAFEDNYGTGVPNFLYNADPADERVTLICHETPPGSVDPALVRALGAQCLYFDGTPACAP